jgi:hypothetical protein
LAKTIESIAEKRDNGRAHWAADEGDVCDWSAGGKKELGEIERLKRFAENV